MQGSRRGPGRSMPAWVHPFFWDTDPRELSLDRHRIFIVERLLNAGDHLTLAWLFDAYGVEEIKDAVIESRGLTPKTARCWQNYFDLAEEELCSTGTPWMR